VYSCLLRGRCLAAGVYITLHIVTIMFVVLKVNACLSAVTQALMPACLVRHWSAVCYCTHCSLLVTCTGSNSYLLVFTSVWLHMTAVRCCTLWQLENTYTGEGILGTFRELCGSRRMQTWWGSVDVDKVPRTRSLGEPRQEQSAMNSTSKVLHHNFIMGPNIPSS
jgi:hypothetical protein